ncbi:MAG TPA: hypothetical protein VL633_03225 [Bacteroidota bacterium]|nr:hypothetical protein [Bacteroidota bacterium]
MQETEQVNRAEAFHRKLDETKRRAFEEEVARLEKETEARGTALAKMLQLKDNHLFEELTKEAETSRHREKELLKKRESDIRTRLKDEHARKRMRRAEEDRLRREAAEEQKTRDLRQKEESARKAEEERRRWEEQLRRQEEEQLRMIEAERRQREDENSKTADEARSKAEAARRKSEEEHQIVQMQQQREQEEQANAEAARWQREQEEERLREEEAMRLQREEFRRKEEERVKREAEEKVLQAELRRQEEENFRRQEEENRKREEEDRVRREAEEKVRLEEELRRQVEERHREAEEHKRQQAEESLRIEKERQAKESGSREGRIRELVTNAEAYFTKGDLEHALVEVAKALVNDPSNEAAIQLEKKIKEAQGIQEPQEQEEAAPARKRKRRELKPQFETREKKKSIFSQPLVVAGAVVVVAILVFAGLQLKKKIFPATTTVAIQPWTGTSNNPEDLVIGSSLAEEVAKQFQQYKKTSVMGYASAFGISKADSRPQAGLFSMGASHILQGTVTKSALGVSVNVKLVDSLGNSKWSEHYDRTLATLPTLPAEIATKLAEVLDLPRDRAYAPMTTTSNGDAYGNYLRGIELLHHRSAANLRSASDLLRQSAEADPSFVQALSAASICLSTMAEENWVPFDSGVGAARDYAEKAIKANSAMGDGYVALGRVMTLFRDYPAAAEQYTLALKYSPANSAAYVGRGKNYLRLAKFKDAIDAFTKAYELDPRDPDVLSSLGFAYQLSGNPEQGAQYHSTALSFVSDSTDYLIGPVCDAILLDPDLSMSQSARVISACEHRIVQNPDDYATIYRLSRTLQVTGKRIEGTTLLDKLETALRAKLKMNPSNANAMIYLALTLTRMGRFPEATMWGQKAYELNSSDPVTCFRLAQMYSLQMYSSQRKKTDDKKKEEATKALKQALRLSYRVDELANADFYNMYEHGDFLSVISANPK